jgi:hypothetical protein
MATLNDDVKRFIVQALACYDTPTQVAEAVKEEFGISIERSHVQAYDPTKQIGKSLSKKWIDLFEETRKKFLEDASEVGIANRSVRIRALSRMVANAEKQRNYALAAQLLEQAAKEVGDWYVNRPRANSPGGGGGGVGLADILREIGERMPN